MKHGKINQEAIGLLGDLKFITLMLMMTAVFGVLLLLSGCATISTEFVDADGTGFTARSTGVLAKAQTDNQSLSYELDEGGTWRIHVGQQAVNSDATAMANLLNNTLPALITALARVPSGGDSEPEPGILDRIEEMAQRIERIQILLDRLRPEAAPIIIAPR